MNKKYFVAKNDFKEFVTESKSNIRFDEFASIMTIMDKI